MTSAFSAAPAAWASFPTKRIAGEFFLYFPQPNAECNVDQVRAQHKWTIAAQIRHPEFYLDNLQLKSPGDNCRFGGTHCGTMFNDHFLATLMPSGEQILVGYTAQGVVSSVMVPLKRY